MRGLPLFEMPFQPNYHSDLGIWGVTSVGTEREPSIENRTLKRDCNQGCAAPTVLPRTVRYQYRVYWRCLATELRV